MPKIPINEIPYKNTDEEAIEYFGDVLIDGFIETVPDKNAKITRKRPGLGMHLLDLGTNSPVDALYWWNGRKVAVAVSGGKVFKITKSGSTLTAIEITGSKLSSGNRVTFAELGSTLTGFKLAMAAGGKINYTLDAVTVSEVSDSDAPTEVTHIDFLDTYILANVVGSGEFRFCEPGDITDWSSINFAVAEGRPDDLKALLVRHREIFLMGEQTIEIWYNDGVNPFSRITMIEYGVLAPYSTCFDGADLYFLNNDKQITRLQGGRTPVVLSTPYDQFIQTKLEYIDDMFAYILNMEGKKWYVAQFPTENRTLVYDILENAWYEWGKWQNNYLETLAYNRFLGNCHAYCPNWGMNLIGSRIDGKIYDISLNNYHDGGEKIRTLKRTGKITHGTTQIKQSLFLWFKATCGKGKPDGSPSFFGFRFRDDGRKQWSNERKVSLGAEGVTKETRKFSRMGMYRSRQYEFIHSDISPFTLIDAEEEVQIIPR